MESEEAYVERRDGRDDGLQRWEWQIDEGLVGVGGSRRGGVVVVCGSEIVGGMKEGRDVVERGWTVCRCRKVLELGVVSRGWGVVGKGVRDRGGGESGVCLWKWRGERYDVVGLG